MNSDQSVLTTIIKRVRIIMDEVDVDGKFKDDTMVRHILPTAIDNVLARLTMDRANPIYLDYSFTTSTTEGHYVLPPNIQEIERLVRLDTATNLIIDEIRPRARFDWRGPGWTIEGNELLFDPLPVAAETWHVLYIPSGLMFPHSGTGTLAADLQTLTLDATPTLGDLDRRIGGYNGQVLRIIPTTGVVEERIIETHTFSTPDWTVATRRPFSSTIQGSVLYEIVPAAITGLMESIVYACCLKLATIRRLAGTTQASIQRDLHSAIKTEGDRITNLNARVPQRWQTRTQDTDIGRINPFIVL